MSSTPTNYRYFLPIKYSRYYVTRAKANIRGCLSFESQTPDTALQRSGLLMRREEKRKRFHEAVLRTLYPPPSPPDSEEEEDNKHVITSERAVHFEFQNPDDFEESKSSSQKTDDEHDGSQAATQKLSRAQRKRLRKKKLKEDALRRGNIIGPLLPSSERGEIGSLQGEPEGVRENAPDEQVASSDQPGDEQGDCSTKKKLKQRRNTKRLAKEGLKTNEGENCDHEKEC